MRRIIATMIFGAQIAFASVIFQETPSKMKAFIEENIGAENFFRGKNEGEERIVVKKTKDFVYFGFDLYKTVSMTTGVRFNYNNKVRRMTLYGQKYSVEVAFEDIFNKDTKLKNSTVIFIFTKM